MAQDLKRKKVKFKYEEEQVHYVVPATARYYTPDLLLPNGIYVEVKGRWTAHDRRKMGLVLEQNPDLDIRMLFAVDNKISRNSKTRYSNWCDRRNIIYHIGKEVPEEWISESCSRAG